MSNAHRSRAKFENEARAIAADAATAIAHEKLAAIREKQAEAARLAELLHVTTPAPAEVERAEQEVVAAEHREAAERARPVLIESARDAAEAWERETKARTALVEWLERSPLGELRRARRARLDAAARFSRALVDRCGPINTLRFRENPAVSDALNGCLAEVGADVDTTAVQSTLDSEHAAFASAPPVAADEWTPLVSAVLAMLMPPQPVPGRGGTYRGPGEVLRP